MAIFILIPKTGEYETLQQLFFKKPISVCIQNSTQKGIKSIWSLKHPKLWLKF